MKEQIQAALKEKGVPDSMLKEAVEIAMQAMENRRYSMERAIEYVIRWVELVKE